MFYGRGLFHPVLFTDAEAQGKYDAIRSHTTRYWTMIADMAAGLKAASQNGVYILGTSLDGRAVHLGDISGTAYLYLTDAGVEYSVKNWYTNVKQRGDRRIIGSKNASYVMRHITPHLGKIVLAAQHERLRQIDSVRSFCLSSLNRANGGSAMSNPLVVSMSVETTYELLKLASEADYALTQIPTASLVEIQQSYAKIKAKLVVRDKFVAQVKDLLHGDKLLLGYHQYGDLTTGYTVTRLKFPLLNSQPTAIIESPKMYRDTNELFSSPYGEEIKSAIVFMKASRDRLYPNNPTWRDAAKIIPCGDEIYPDIGMAAYSVGALMPYIPHHLMLPKAA